MSDDVETIQAYGQMWVPQKDYESLRAEVEELKNLIQDHFKKTQTGNTAWVETWENNRRLRAELNAQEGVISDLRSLLAAKDKRIEELTRWNFEDKADYLKRIEELEDASVLDAITFGLDQMNRGRDKYYIITDEQIDKAWDRLNGDTEETWTEYTHGVFDTLDDLNIVACEECGGSGKKESRSSSMREEPMLWTCPTCNGHGWRIK